VYRTGNLALYLSHRCPAIRIENRAKMYGGEDSNWAFRCVWPIASKIDGKANEKQYIVVSRKNKTMQNTYVEGFFMICTITEFSIVFALFRAHPIPAWTAAFSDWVRKSQVSG